MSTISASTTSTTGYVVTSDTTGTLVFRTGASPTTAMTLGSDQSVTFAGAQTYTGAATFTTGISVQGLTVGRGAGAVSTNTAVGASALESNTTGSSNSSIGRRTLINNSTGSSNTALGNDGLYANTTGSFNVALGQSALFSNTTASYNTAVGYRAAYSNTVASITAVGTQALEANTSGVRNAAFGFQALSLNTTGTDNFAAGSPDSGGWATLNVNTTGSYNTAVGNAALSHNTTGSSNTATGYQAGYSLNGADGNTLVGYQSGYSLVGSGYNNTFIGRGAGYYMTGTKNTILGGYNGNQGGLDIRTSSNYIVLSDGDGNPRMYINGSGTWFYATAPAGAGTNAVKYNSSTGALTYDTSSARYKDNIRDSIYGLNHVMQMRSTQFEYKDTGRSDVGLIAEELDPIIPELVGKNADGQPDSVSYDRMVSVLVKAIQELKAEFDAYEEAHP